MVVYNYSGKEINAKIVYYGPALSGKTTNLEWIYSKIPVEYSGKMVSLRTQADRTIFFDFLPLDLGMIDGFRTRFMLYTVPGQVHYNATRKMVLKGVDGVVFVADSEPGRMQDNIESLQNLRDNLQELGMNPDSLPLVLQWNKRDLPGCMDVGELEAELNPRALPSFEACALTGEGVYETLHKASRMMYGRMAGDGGPGLSPPTEDSSLFGESIAECLQDIDHPEPEPERVAVAPLSVKRPANSGADALGAILGNGAATPSSEAEPVQEAAIEVPTVGASAPVPAATQSAAMHAVGAADDPVKPVPPSSLPPEQVPATLDGVVEDVLHNLQQDSSEVDSVNQKNDVPAQGQQPQETVADRLDAFFQGPDTPQASRPVEPAAQPPQQPVAQQQPPAQQPPQQPAAPQASRPVEPAPQSRPAQATEGFDVEHDVDVIEELSDASRGPGASEPVDLDAMFSEIGAVPVSGESAPSAPQAPAPAETEPESELEDLGLITDPLKTRDEARAISRSVSSVSAVSGSPFSGGAPASGPASAGPTASRILEVPVTLDQSIFEQGGSIRIVLNVTVK